MQINILLANTVFYGDVKQGLWHTVIKAKWHREESAINCRDLSNNLWGNKNQNRQFHQISSKLVKSMLSLVSHNVTLFTLSVSAFLDQEPIIWQALLCSNHTMQFTHPHCPLGITALLHYWHYCKALFLWRLWSMVPRPSKADLGIQSLVLQLSILSEDLLQNLCALLLPAQVQCAKHMHPLGPSLQPQKSENKDLQLLLHNK